MLNSNSQISEDQFTEKEKETVQLHHKSTESQDIEWNSIMCTWRDNDGILCIQYSNQEWYHYNEKGEWW